MEINYRGGNCITIDVKKETIIIDGALSKLGLKDIVEKDAVYIATQEGLNPGVKDGIQLDRQGEYEVRGVSVKGVSARRMIETDESKLATIYRIALEGVSIAVVGHVRSPLSEDELEKIGMVDIVVIPVGGGGYTMDAHQAVGVIRQLEPKVVIPTHYAENGIKYEVPQNGIEEFITEMGGEHQKLSSFKIKNSALPAVLTVIEITRS